MHKHKKSTFLQLDAQTASKISISANTSFKYRESNKNVLNIQSYYLIKKIRQNAISFIKKIMQFRKTRPPE